MWRIVPSTEALALRIVKGISLLNATVIKIYHPVETSYMESVYEHAVKNIKATAQPVMMIKYPHLYTIRISWTPTTYIALCLWLLITLTAYLLLGCWIRATYRFGCEE